MTLYSEALPHSASTGSPSHEHPTKAITKTEFLSDSVRIYFFCHRPWGMNDERSMVELPYAGVRALPGLPVDHGHGEFRETWDESVYLQPPNATIIFRFVTWQESDDCRMEALVGGPYLALLASQASGSNLNPE